MRFGACGVRLAGTIIIPATPGRHPAVVFVHGAAGGQRDFNRLFARPFLDAGVAVLIYDKAGHGLSEGTEPTIFDQRDAAWAALDLLAGRSDVDAARIGLAGFSNGMWSVPMVAARRSDVAFVVGIGSPGVSMAQSEVHRRVKVLREAGVGEPILVAVARAWRCVFALAAAGTAGAAMIADPTPAPGGRGPAGPSRRIVRGSHVRLPRLPLRRRRPARPHRLAHPPPATPRQPATVDSVKRGEPLATNGSDGQSDRPAGPDRSMRGPGRVGGGTEPGPREALWTCREGDTQVVTKLDRPARSLPAARYPRDNAG